MTQEPKQPRVLYFIREYWVVLVFMVGLIVTWTNFKAADVSAADRLTKLELAAVVTAETSNQILVQLGQLQTDIQWIKLRLNTHY